MWSVSDRGTALGPSSSRSKREICQKGDCAIPHPRCFWQKNPQSDENKGRGLQNCAKSSQLLENSGDASSRSKPKRKWLGNPPGATKVVVRPTAMGFWGAKVHYTYYYIYI